MAITDREYLEMKKAQYEIEINNINANKRIEMKVYDTRLAVITSELSDIERQLVNKKKVGK